MKDEKHDGIDDWDPDPKELLNTIGQKQIIRLNNNCNPGELVPLERLFDNNDVAKNLRVMPDGNEVQECNIGTTKAQDGKIIYIFIPKRKR